MKISKIKKTIVALIMAATVMVSQIAVFADETVPEPEAGSEAQETYDLSQYSFETIYGSQLMPFLNHQYYFEGKEIPIAESNFYFINAFLEFNNIAAYGYYPQTAEGFVDLSAPIDAELYDNYGEFFVAYSEQTLQTTYVTNLRANDMGLQLSDETEAAIDQMIANLNEQGAQLANMSLDEYIKLYYGESCDEAAFRAILHNYYLSDLYVNQYCSTYEHKPEDKSVPNIRYALFYAPGGSDETELTNAETLANEMLSAATDMESLKSLGEQAALDGVVLDQGDILVKKGDTVQDFENWAYAAHNVGDMDVIYSPDYGYFVVGYLGMEDVAQEDLDEIAVSALTDEVKAAIEGGTYNFYTNDEYAPAVPVEGTSTTDGNTTSPSETQVTAQVVEKDNKTGVLNIVLIILAVIGGVAIVAVIVIMVVFFVRNGSSKKSDEKKEEKEEEEKSEIDDTSDI